MSVLEEFAKKRAEKRKMSARERDIHFATLSNDKTKADEILLFVRYFLLPLSAIWVAYVGYIHLSKELVGVVPEEHVWWLAMGIPVIFQCIKAYCATTVFRAFHFKWYDHSKADFWIYLILAFITLFTFVWTLKISFWDVKDTAKSNFVDKNTVSLDAHLKAATADVDAQIAALGQKQNDAGSVRTKNGKVNWATQPIIAQNAKTEAALIDQRATIVGAATKEFNNKNQRIEMQSQKSGGFFQRFGGFGELLEILCFILCGLLEKKMHQLNCQDEDGEDRGNATLPHFNAKNINGQTHPLHNKAPQRFYFNRESIDGNVMPAPFPIDELSRQPLFPPDTENTVSQFQPTVSQQNGADMTNQADAVLILAEKQLRGFVSNFGRNGGKDSTVSFNINRILTRTANDVRQNGFQPTREVWLKFYTYIQGDLFPLLNSKGWPYEFEKQFVADVYRIGPKESVPA